MKKCTKCGEVKPLNDYRKLRNKCRICERLNEKDRRRTKEGLILKIYLRQKSSSIKRGMGDLCYSRKQLSSWIINNKHFNDIYNKWVLSDYDADLTPSIDRINNNIGYSLSNITLVTWAENRTKNHLDRKNGNDSVCKKIAQFTLHGLLVSKYVSISEASRITGYSTSKISMACNGKINHYNGFHWEFI
jgi:hypothetical protein